MLAIGAAVFLAFTVDGCQSILGIDPDERQPAGAIDGSSSDVTSDVAQDAGADVLIRSDAGDAASSCHVAGDCTAPKHYCEKTICDAGVCEIVSADGDACDITGSCRGYACVSGNLRLAASGDTTCMLDAEGQVWCWGGDANGQLGDQASGARSTPYLVPHIGDDLAKAIQISVGYDHACAALVDNSVVCWGANAYGQSSGEDAGGATAPIGPTVVREAPPSQLVAAGTGHTCALGKDVGDVWCWGDNEVGEIGAGSAAKSVVSRPTRIDLLSQMQYLSGDAKTVCASDDTKLLCWGDNTWGQLGENCASSFCPFPVAIADLDAGPSGRLLSSVAVTWGNVCAVAGADDNVLCWGNDRGGQLGNGRAGGFGDGGLADQAFPDPGAIWDPDDAGFFQSAFGVFGTGTHFCVQKILTREFVCWGENVANEIGDIRVGYYPEPFRPSFFDGVQQAALGDAHACVLKPEPDHYYVSCFGHAQAGQIGDGLPITERVQSNPTHVQFPNAPGGIAGIRAHQ